MNLEPLKPMTLEQRVDYLLEQSPLLEGKIRSNCDLGERSAKAALLEALRFLDLLDPSYVLTPSIRVDQVWHEFILFTRLYDAYCQTCYGRFLHHQPDDNTSNNQKQFELCIEKYHQRFGLPENWFWGKQLCVDTQGACSGCESS